MEWRPYQHCCHASALDPEATFCGECGAGLLRCMAFTECYGLVEPLAPCPVCVAPALSLDKGAVTSASVGHRLSLPLVLSNTSSIARPLWIERVYTRRSSDPFQPVALPWERIDATDERAFEVDTGALEQGGTASVEVAVSVGSRFKGYEETYLFGANVRVSAEDLGETTIHQTIDMTGATVGDNTMIAPSQRPDVDLATRRDTGSTLRKPLPLTRYERFERDFGLRGYGDTGRRVPRSVGFRFTGFPARHVPPGTGGLGPHGTMIFGRNNREPHPTDNPTPSDVALRILDSTGASDVQASRAISRQHFDLMILNERLMLHVRSSNGVAVNGQALPAAALHPLNDGDTVTPLTNRPEALAIGFRFRARPDGIVETVEITRGPAAA